MGITLKKTRGVSADVGRYQKHNTGTSGNSKNFGKDVGVQRNDPQYVSSRLTETRVRNSGGNRHHEQQYPSNQPSGQAARVIKGSGGRPQSSRAKRAPVKSGDLGS